MKKIIIILALLSLAFTFKPCSPSSGRAWFVRWMEQRYGVVIHDTYRACNAGLTLTR